MRVNLVPFGVAVAFISEHHRHHIPPVGHRFSLGAYKDGRLVGVATVGRPSSRVLDARGWWEVTRTCTDGTRNANSALYGAAWREARKRGAVELITCTMGDESGASLRGAGWMQQALLKPRKGWACPSRDRDDRGVDNVTRIRWAAFH